MQLNNALVESDGSDPLIFNMADAILYQMGQGQTIYQGDSLQLMRQLPADSVDLIVTDPPYFKVKDAPWDHQWDTTEGFLAWIGDLCKEYQRILRPNGSLYVFASPKMSARVETKIAETFAILNHIVWRKGDVNGNGQHSKISEESLRSFFPRTERIIFAEHYGADNIAKGVPGYGYKINEARGFVFEPIRAYLAGEVARAGLTAREVEEYLGNFMARHYIGRSQWELPTQANYEKIRELLNTRGAKPAPVYELHHPAGGLWEKYAQPETEGNAYLGADYHYLRADYEYLSADYEVLKAEFEHLRRPFDVNEREYTDVWDFLTVVGYSGKHPCEKPQELIEHIIATSTRPGDTVLDTFFGSGVTGASAKKLGRRFIGMELDPHWVTVARARVGDTAALLALPDSKPLGFIKRTVKAAGPAAQGDMFAGLFDA